MKKQSSLCRNHMMDKHVSGISRIMSTTPPAPTRALPPSPPPRPPAHCPLPRSRYEHDTTPPADAPTAHISRTPLRTDKQ